MHGHQHRNTQLSQFCSVRHLLHLNCVIPWLSHSELRSSVRIHRYHTIIRALNLTYGSFTLSVSVDAAMTLVILVWLKTMQSHSEVISLFSMRTGLLVSSQNCRSVDADAWCKRALTESFQIITHLTISYLHASKKFSAARILGNT